jgi:SAM-dependent methyltransferase
MIDHISEANRVFFEGGSETEQYLNKPTHQCRLRVMRSVIQRELRRSRMIDRDIRVLDIGCSSALATAFLFEGLPNVQLFGLDISHLALAAAHRQGVIGIAADVAKGLPVRDKIFDVIVAGEIIEHLLDVDRFLLEIHRSLKPDGVLLLSTPNLARLVDRLRFIFGFTPKQCIPNHRYLRFHITPFTLSSLRETLLRCGFYIQAFRSTYVHLDPTMQRDYKSRFLAQVLPSLGSSLVVAARKKNQWTDPDPDK